MNNLSSITQAGVLEADKSVAKFYRCPEDGATEFWRVEGGRIDMLGNGFVMRSCLSLQDVDNLLRSGHLVECDAPPDDGSSN